METLKKLTPAETLLLRDQSKVILKDLLKYTLIDLIIKKVLIVEEEEEQSHPNNPVRSVSYVKVGPNYKSYTFKRHELVFANPFLGNDEIRILFRHLIKMGFENAAGLKLFVFERIVKSKEMEGMLKTSWFNKLFVYINLSDKGDIKSKKVQDELKELEKTLASIIKKEPEQGKDIVTALAGNIFLLEGFDYKLLEKIDSEMAEEMKKQKDSSGDYGCAGCYIYFDSYSSSFDSEASSFDSGGDSGCGGTSGCSGCSGCGGCGGCG
ncbi:hypothetical protein [Ekhidna sp.]